MKKSGITKTQMDEIIPNENSLRESQKKIGSILIRNFGVRRSMKEIDNNYVRYCLYDDVRISLEKLLVCNRKMIELTEGLTFKDLMEQAFKVEEGIKKSCIKRINTQPIKKGIPKERHPNFFC